MDQTSERRPGGGGAAEDFDGGKQREPNGDGRREQAADGHSAGEPDWRAVVKRLAALPPIEADVAMREAARGVGCTVGALRDAVAKARGSTAGGDEPAPGSGRPLDLPEPEPWPRPVDGARLIDSMADAIARHVVLPPAAADAIALWVLHAHAIDAARFAPRLLLHSPERRCGKTTMLAALTELCPRALPASNISPAALFRVIEAAQPTLLLDEADTFMRDSEEMRGVVNSGHSRAASFVVRLVETGGDFVPRQFSTWGAMAIAGIGRQAATIEDRSLAIDLRRKLPGEAVVPLDDAARHALAILARKAARWASDHLDALAGARPARPAGLNSDRAADNWSPLLAIADAAGGGWPARAREAAVALIQADDDGDGLRTRLLADCRDIFAARGNPERLASAELLAALVAMETSPWGEASRGKALSPHRLARLLKPYGIAPAHGRAGNSYSREAFADAWARYLSEPGGFNPSQLHGASESAGSAAFQSFTGAGGREGLQSGENPHKRSVCEAVKLCTPQEGEPWEI